MQLSIFKRLLLKCYEHIELILALLLVVGLALVETVSTGAAHMETTIAVAGVVCLLIATVNMSSSIQVDGSGKIHPSPIVFCKAITQMFFFLLIIFAICARTISASAMR